MWKWLSVVYRRRGRRTVKRFKMNGHSVKLACSLVATLMLMGFPSGASAQTEMTGVRAMGMGEAFTASATGTGALFHNPAGISALMMYSMEAAYVHDLSTGVNVLHASITDGKSNAWLGGGVGYSYSTSSDEAELAGFTGHDFYSALSVPAVPGWVMVGVTMHYLDYNRFDENVADGVTLDAGLLVSLGDFITFGAAGRNLIDIDGLHRTKEAKFGLSFHNYMFSVNADTFVNFGEEDPTVSFAAGAEVLIGSVVPVRLGYLNNRFTSHSSISTGVGYRSSLFGGDILFRQDLGESDRRMLGLAFNLYL